MSCITEEEYKALCKIRPQSVFIYTHPALYDEVDKYWGRYSSPEWLIICQWFYAFYKDIIDAKQGRVNPKDNIEYVWVNYGLLAQRLGCYGIRNPDTIGKWLSRLSAANEKYPPLLHKWVYFDLTTGHSNVYLAPTDDCHRMFAVPKTAEGILEYKKRRSLAESTEGSQIPEFYETIESASEEASPIPPEKAVEPFIFPDWWEDFANEVDSMYKYANKVYKKDGMTMNKYIVDAVNYINSLLDGSFYETYGGTLTNRYDLSDMSLAKIIDGLRNCWVPNDKGHVADVILPHAIDKKPRKSPLLDTIFGTRFQKEPPKSSKFLIKEESYEPGKDANDKKGDRAPESIWFGENNGFNERPDKYYSELTFNHPRVWGLYHCIKEYAESCKAPEGIWTIHNKLGTTISELDILYWILKVASEHGVTSDEIFQNIIIGDDRNYLWALVMQFIYNKNSYKLARDEVQSKYLYCGAKDIDPSKYTRAVGKGVKK